MSALWLRADLSVSVHVTHMGLVSPRQVVVHEVDGEMAKLRTLNGNGVEGWARMRNISRIERSSGSGLADIEELAKVAVDELSKRDMQMQELEDMVRDHPPPHPRIAHTRTPSPIVLCSI